MVWYDYAYGLLTRDLFDVNFRLDFHVDESCADGLCFANYPINICAHSKLFLIDHILLAALITIISNSDDRHSRLSQTATLIYRWHD
jgi:hypothetical protein